MKTRKLLAILIAAIMVFALLPASVFAAGLITAIPVIHNLTTTDLVLDGETFDGGEILVVNAAGKNVTIKNCTFKDPVGAYNYACTITNAGNVTIENNIVDGSWRAFNVSISSSASKLTATGNTITLTQITDPAKAEKNVGIQVYGGNWLAANISIENNSFTNATTAFRLHYSFAFATENGDAAIALENNRLTNCANYVGYDPGDGTSSENDPIKRAALAAIVAKINATQGTEVTAKADVAYTVIIPASVDFGTIYKTMPVQSKAFPITVRDALLEDGAKITVAKTSGDKMYAGSKELPFTFTPSSKNFIFGGDETQNGSVSCTPAALTAAGSYKGYMTFSVTYAKPAG